MCTGRVDLEFIFRALLNGVDGVFIGGCHLNECNYLTHGNYQALNMVLLCRKIMEHIGLNKERLRIGFMSSGEGNLFAEAVDDFGEKIREIGPLGLAEGLSKTELKEKIREVVKLIPYLKIAKREKLETRLENEELYDDFYTGEEIAELFRDVASYHIDPKKCQACGICLRKCPVEAIEGDKNQIHVIDQDKCIKCGTCLESCPPRFGAVHRICGEPIPAPLPPAERTIVRKAKEKAAAPQ